MPKTNKKKRKAHDAIQYLSEQEIDQFFRVIRDVRDRAIFRLMYHRGLRASEPGRLMLSDYRANLGKPRLRVVRCKGSRTLEHPLLPVEIRAMKAWLKIRGVLPGPLFLSREHKAIHRQQIWVLMKRYCILAGIPADKAHPHVLKHSCGTHVAKLLGGNIVEVQDHLGHADIRNTMIYVESMQRESRADRLADWGNR